jgi:hypothetical protein
VPGSERAQASDIEPDARGDEPVVPAAPALVRRLGPTNWLVTADGRQLVARSCGSSGELDHSALAAIMQLGAPQLVPASGVAESDGTSWLLSEHVDGVALLRLLTVATLTPLQAGYVAAQIGAGIVELHEAGLAHGRLVPANVIVGPDGGPRLTDWAVSSLAAMSSGDELRAGDLVQLRALVATLARNADRPAARKREVDGALLRGLERFGAGPGRGYVHVLARELEALFVSSANGTGAAVRAELANLVDVLVNRPGPDDYAVVEPPPPVTPVDAFPPGSLTRTALIPTRRPWRRWAAVLALVAVLGGVGYVVARKPIDRLLHRDVASDSTPSQPARSTAPGKTERPAVRRNLPHPVPTLGPASAGFVTAVVARPLSTCAPGRSCAIWVTIRLVPTATSTYMNWGFAVVNRCSGRVRHVSGGTMTAQPGWADAYDTRTVRLPDAHSLAVVAMTNSPVRVASEPLLVPRRDATC